jgi:mannosylglycerate synthase
MTTSSLVVFPFKAERPEVVVANIRVAAAHERVGEVVCVGYEVESTYRAIEAARHDIEVETGTPVRLVLQERIGVLRPGKGDGMNTGLRYLLGTDHDRLHFYDSDITSFDARWITRAEEAADAGYGVVRHSFPRASTDGMITWFVTRPGLAILFPRSQLPWIEQPLGGEMLLTRPVAEMLAADTRVADRSDWGIDTAITFALVGRSVPMYEVYMPQGKSHALYRGLTDLKTMLVECFDAVQSLRGLEVPAGIVHRAEPPLEVPEAITTKVGYDVEATLRLLGHGWSDRQAALLGHFPPPVRDGMLAVAGGPVFGFMTDDLWYDTHRTALDHFDMTDPDWNEVLFRLWVVRVLAYTMSIALRGYGYAMQSLRDMMNGYLRRSALER